VGGRLAYLVFRSILFLPVHFEKIESDAKGGAKRGGGREGGREGGRACTSSFDERGREGEREGGREAYLVF